MKKLSVRTATKEYPVITGSGALKEIVPLLLNMKPAVTSLMVISDDNVAPLYLSDVTAELSKTALPVYDHIVPHGDQEKSFQNYFSCQTAALEFGLDRHSVIIALGGGMVGDLAGFVAGTYMRGIRFIQVPTTLLAHDSSVGGKTGINHHLGKNMIGVFHHPEAVIYDAEYLKTLPQHEIRSGFAEVIKHAIIKDRSFYRYLHENVRSLDDLGYGTRLEEAITKGIQIKAEIVQEDERENGVRALLNFGHTLGHAIEAELGYGKWTHGDAVAAGMLFALRIGASVYGTSLIEDSEINEWLQELGYPQLPASLSPEKLLSRMKKDKKAHSGTVKMVLLPEIGKAEVREVPDPLLIEELHKFLAAK
ncbi:3-dehydroquinate synthase [Fictibacillus aquaticus]|uniref:3-dehydroquinate synthase n=1 Tax=Fictibacillus aquaticus TaxID=2021314 RepID=A0A235FCZ7_9BACL|nr:3-dehydroquinate synthase [Fictibacillus aquaticus]OYD59260.1 3-dehydroquinate synthase [Fictibacillus aquaticus]